MSETLKAQSLDLIRFVFQYDVYDNNLHAKTTEYNELERLEIFPCSESVSFSVSVVYKGTSTYEYITKQRQLQSSRQPEEGATQLPSSNGAASQVKSSSHI